ncbi:kynureninase [Paraburkholderia sp. MPAMCS5]|uniref:kynureninase n=1 Tax=Paraburkholderia sp. MPAMCS5 TaxID=3112563 RepID=UPI002E1754D1|nr:kynureninase [Paraburkholderia sp. MPAMCS5]
MEHASAAMRDRFCIPEGVRYFDGNSLGLMPKVVQLHASNVITHEWGHGLIHSWHDAEWRTLPQRTGAKIAALLGAKPEQVVACDSTSVNLFKVLVAAVGLRSSRNKIVTDSDSFPTDLYIVEQVARLFGLTVVAVPAREIELNLDDQVAAVVLTHVDYRSAEIYDMQAYTRRAHECGALIVWDLSHTAGAVPCDLDGSGTDFAVGCGYKYLNGGPGAPAYLYVAERHADLCEQPLAGWFGHARPFDFAPNYTPASGAARFLCGTNPVIGLSVLSRALDIFEGISMDDLRSQSIRLTSLFIESVDTYLSSHGFTVASPRDAARRGSHVSLRHQRGYGVMQELAKRKFIGDFRMPNYMRFGFAPLYNTEEDVHALIDAIDQIMTSRAWEKPEYQERRDFT